jgi:hypothetical protein
VGSALATAISATASEGIGRTTANGNGRFVLEG